MQKINLKELNIEKTHNHLKNGDFTVRELVDEYLKVIKEKNESINAYLEIYNDIERIKKYDEILQYNVNAVPNNFHFHNYADVFVNNSSILNSNNNTDIKTNINIISNTPKDEKLNLSKIVDNHESKHIAIPKEDIKFVKKQLKIKSKN